MDLLCLDFMNTSWYLTHKTNREMLNEPAFVEEFFNRRGYLIDTSPNAVDLSSLLELRDFLRGLLEEIVKNKTLNSDNLHKMISYLSNTTFHRTIVQKDDHYQIKLMPTNNDWDWIKTEIVASFLALIEEYDSNRIRTCENPDCCWLFYDETKSRTKRWCCDACGNLIKVRRFRANKKNPSETD